MEIDLWLPKKTLGAGTYQSKIILCKHALYYDSFYAVSRYRRMSASSEEWGRDWLMLVTFVSTRVSGLTFKTVWSLQYVLGDAFAKNIT